MRRRGYQCTPRRTTSAAPTLGSSHRKLAHAAARDGSSHTASLPTRGREIDIGRLMWRRRKEDGGVEEKLRGRM